MTSEDLGARTGFCVRLACQLIRAHDFPISMMFRYLALGIAMIVVET